MTDVPEELGYTTEHEWIRADGNRMVVGITDYAQDQLGDVVFVTLPEIGTDVTAGTPLGEVESTKSVSDVYSPVTGRVVDRNGDLEANPELINAEPYERGWLVVIETDLEAEGLLDATAYRAHVDEA